MTAVQPRDRLRSLDEQLNVPLHIALVEPEIPPNTGNVARLCAATGCVLHLVEPLGFSIDDRELKRAGLDYWNHVQLSVHVDLASFLEATAAMRSWYFSKRAAALYSQAEFRAGDVLVFGKETHGLPRELLSREAEHCLRIPMREGTVRSINLSTAVGIGAYAALAKIGFPNLL